MKRLLKLTLILSLTLLFAVALCSCSDESSEGASGKTLTLNVYNWGEYISDGAGDSLDVNLEFEKYYYETYGVKVKVNYTTYANNEDMFNKLKSGAGSYDIVIPSDYMIEKMIDSDMLYAFGTENIENYKYIDDAFKGLYYDPDELYSVPYTYGMVGVIYNYTLLDPEDIDDEGNILNPSWSLMWNEKYAGKILQFNNPRDGFGTAMYYANLDINSTDEAVWQEALALLKQQKPLVQAYVNDEIFNKMTSGSAAISAYYAGDYITMLESNDYLRFYYPEEGTNVFYDAMCIPKSSKNPELAMEYINFMLTEQIAVANALAIGYASPNTLVINNEEYAEEMGEHAMDVLYGEDMVDIQKNYDYNPSYKGFTDGMLSYVNGLWEELKTEDAIEPWIHVTSVVIVGGLLAFGGYSVYIKKMRSRFYRERDKALRSAKTARSGK